MTDKEKILSNDFIDLLLDAPIPLEEIPQGSEYFIQEVDASLDIMYRQISSLPLFYIDSFTYQLIPGIFGLMQTPGAQQATFDPTALIRSGILEVQRAPLSLTGKGVIIGFVDTGIRYDNDVFRNPDGSSRILAIWDQTIQDGEPPEGILYGTEYTQEMINQALRSENPREIVPSYDDNGHGTAMASVAAGSILGNGLIFQGAAPDAEIVVVKCKQAKQNLRDFFYINQEADAYSEADIIMGIKYLQSYAISFQRPLVICLGIGSNMGDHTGSSFLGAYLNRLAVTRSNAVVVCGGNEGNSAHHYVGELTHEANALDYDEVEIRVGENEAGFLAEIWGNLPSSLAIRIRTPGGEITEEVDFRSRDRREFSFVYVDTKIFVDFVMVEQNSGAELIVMRFSQPVSGVWTLRITSTEGMAGQIDRFHIWLPITQFLTSDTYFLQPSPYYTLTEPSLAREVITISTYNDANNSFYADSGRGYSRTEGIKPDLAAPGVNVDTILGKRTGSSIAAAIAAGASAQFMQWAVVEKNKIYTESRELKSYLIRGAQRTQDIDYPNREWGYGRLDIANTFERMAGLE